MQKAARPGTLGVPPALQPRKGGIQHDRKANDPPPKLFDSTVAMSATSRGGRDARAPRQAQKEANMQNTMTKMNVAAL